MYFKSIQVAAPYSFTKCIPPGTVKCTKKKQCTARHDTIFVSGSGSFVVENQLASAFFQVVTMPFATPLLVVPPIRLYYNKYIIVEGAAYYNIILLREFRATEKSPGGSKLVAR